MRLVALLRDMQPLQGMLATHVSEDLALPPHPLSLPTLPIIYLRASLTNIACIRRAPPLRTGLDVLHVRAAFWSGNDAQRAAEASGRLPSADNASAFSDALTEVGLPCPAPNRYPRLSLSPRPLF